MRRTERLFAIAEYLRGRRTGTTAEALAERFGVTMRTIYRDLESLRAAEMPIQAERGRGGGYALDRSYSLPPINLTAREAAVLIAAGNWLTRMRVLPFAETMNRAIDKIRGALDTTSQRRLLDQLDEPLDLLQAMHQLLAELVVAHAHRLVHELTPGDVCSGAIEGGWGGRQH